MFFTRNPSMISPCVGISSSASSQSSLSQPSSSPTSSDFRTSRSGAGCIRMDGVRSSSHRRKYRISHIPHRMSKQNRSRDRLPQSSGMPPCRVKRHALHGHRVTAIPYKKKNGLHAQSPCTSGRSIFLKGRMPARCRTCMRDGLRNQHDHDFETPAPVALALHRPSFHRPLLHWGGTLQATELLPRR